jgi:hypothetical protein
MPKQSVISKKNSLIIKNNFDLIDLLFSNYSLSIMLKKTVLKKSTPNFSQINSMKQNRKIGIRRRLNDNLERI